MLPCTSSHNDCCLRFGGRNCCGPEIVWAWPFLEGSIRLRCCG